MTRLGYLVPEWPAQTHAFFWRELTALRGLLDRLRTNVADPDGVEAS